MKMKMKTVEIEWYMQYILILIVMVATMGFVYAVSGAEDRAEDNTDNTELIDITSIRYIGFCNIRKSGTYTSLFLDKPQATQLVKILQELIKNKNYKHINLSSKFELRDIDEDEAVYLAKHLDIKVEKELKKSKR